MEKGGAISAEKDDNGDNPLHLLASVCMEHDMSDLIKSLNTDVSILSRIYYMYYNSWQPDVSFTIEAGNKINGCRHQCK